MSIDRLRRTTFEAVADWYREARPGYPATLVDDVVRFANLAPDGRILEIGCGPGNATLPFAQRGYHLLAVELGERLAALAAARCRDYPRVAFRRMAFEDWPVEAEAFDLAIAADAFHWIPPEIGYPKVAQALKPSGAAAFFWFVPVDPQTDWSRAIDEVYREQAPGLENPDRSFTAEWLAGIIRANFRASGCFGKPMVRVYHWSEAYTAERYLKLLQTYSSHADLDPETRRRLYAEIGRVLERHGGAILRPFQVVLFQARLKPSAALSRRHRPNQ
ncbi:MAG: methyltransferase domain-containing protein [Anaerolineales bacterium]|nr:methyltransferase domain-containing protein [Anaerolineales bacterium]